MPRNNDRRFGPKAADHPSIGERCPACHEPFKEGDYTTLILIGPGNDKEEKAKARDGRTYNAVCVEVHWECSEHGSIEDRQAGI